MTLSFSDREKWRRLSETFRLNFRLTRDFAAYLSDEPELITKEMVDTLTGDGDVTKEDAIAALLSEFFGYGLEDAEGRRLYHRYLRPSIVLLDAARYTENPYYQNIRIDNIRDGAWELRRERYAPYRGVICGDMRRAPDHTEIPPLGFFTGEFSFPAVLENGNEWMTLTPVDLDTCEDAIRAAHGRVVTFGLGLGYYAYMVSEKPEVESVTVVETSPDVIRLFRTHILPQFPHREKIRIVQDDAFHYAEFRMPGERFDLAFVDTWRDASDGAPMYLRMSALEKKSPGTVFLYWIENFLLSRLCALRFSVLADAVEKGEVGSFSEIEAALSDEALRQSTDLLF